MQLKLNVVVTPVLAFHTSMYDHSKLHNPLSVTDGTGITTTLVEQALTIGLSSAYQTNIANGVSAYGWGNHASAGYIKSDGSISFSNAISGVSPTLGSHLATKDFVIAQIHGQTWQNPVYEIKKDIPVLPQLGDRYIVKIGDNWDISLGSTFGNYIAEFDGHIWQFEAPQNGDSVKILYEDKYYTYNGTSKDWVSMGSLVAHSSLLGLGDDDHTQYFNQVRGDARYSLSSHNHTGVYEPAFSKNTAFNKNFGTTAGTVAAGDHTHTGVYEVSGAVSTHNSSKTAHSGGFDSVLINKADSSALTDFLINPTAKTSGNLIDAQVNGVSKFLVDYLGSGKLISNLGSELAPIISGNSGDAGGYTISNTSGFVQPFNASIEKTGNGTGNITPTDATNIVAGVTYKVIIVVESISGGNFNWTIGGNSEVSSINTSGTHTEYMTANTTGKFTITTIDAARFKITSISIKALTANSGDLDVNGNLSVSSPIKATGGNDAIWISKAGNVSIGAVNPFSSSYKFSVNGTAGFLGNIVLGAGYQLALFSSLTTNYQSLVTFNVLNNATAGTSNLSSGGITLNTVAWNTTSLSSKANGMASRTIGINGAKTSCRYDVINTTIDGVTNNNILTSVTSDGNFGIQTTTPTANFQVNQSTTGVGTVSNTAGGTTVTGVGTQFLNTFKVGDTITIGGQTVVISAIASDTSMTTAAITNANTNVAYTLVGGTRFQVFGNGKVSINGYTVPSWAVFGAGSIDSAYIYVSNQIQAGTLKTYAANTDLYLTTHTAGRIVYSDRVFKAAGYQSADGSAGVTGTWTTTDGKTITAKDGLITNII